MQVYKCFGHFVLSSMFGVSMDSSLALTSKRKFAIFAIILQNLQVLPFHVISGPMFSREIDVAKTTVPSAVQMVNQFFQKLPSTR